MKAIMIEREMDRKEVKRDISLIKSAAAGMREKKPKRAGKVVVLKDDDDELDEEMNEELDSDIESDDEMIQNSSDEEQAILN